MHELLVINPTSWESDLWGSCKIVHLRQKSWIYIENSETSKFYRITYTLSIFYRQQFNWKTSCQFLNFLGHCLILPIKFWWSLLIWEQRGCKNSGNLKKTSNFWVGIICQYHVFEYFLRFTKKFNSHLSFFCHFMIFSRKRKVYYAVA